MQGDTTTAFASALAAFYEQIPVGHVEAGLRTDNIFDPYPEEANRRLISQVAQLHFAPTHVSARNLAASGVVGQTITTGNSVIDALLLMAKKAPPFELPGLDFEKQRVILATVHRRENWASDFRRSVRASAVLERYPDTALLLPLHRNPTVRDPLQALLGDHPRAFLTEPLDYDRLVAAMRGSTLLLTDSGGLQEEAPALGKPVLVLRRTTERPEAVDAGTAKLIGTDSADILREASLLLMTPRPTKRWQPTTRLGMRPARASSRPAEASSTSAATRRPRDLVESPALRPGGQVDEDSCSGLESIQELSVAAAAGSKGDGLELGLVARAHHQDTGLSALGDDRHGGYQGARGEITGVEVNVGRHANAQFGRRLDELQGDRKGGDVVELGRPRCDLTHLGFEAAIRKGVDPHRGGLTELDPADVALGNLGDRFEPLGELNDGGTAGAG